jgi:hypothetical protein
MSDPRKSIEQTLKGFALGPLTDGSRKLLGVLGYQSDKTVELEPNTWEGFRDAFVQDSSSFNPASALVADWQSIDILFQLTDEELGSTRSLFQTNEIKPGLMASYLFFAIHLKGSSYSRGKLAQITRQLNRIFPMPVMVLFAYGDKLSIAIINRRQHKRDADKDVLGKVTLIQEINLNRPHRGHLEILASLSVAELGGKRAIASFDDLHRAWSQVLDIELLNRNFYRRIAEWFFFAVHQVRFPDGGMADEVQRNRIAVIRLLTRLIFCWFAKEKGLLSERLFNVDTARAMLKEFDPDAFATGGYYKAFLQNLFFPTLSIPIEERKFRTEHRFQGKNKHYMDHSFLRYAALFQDDTVPVELFENIPFLNGGLFECLDYRETKGDFHCEVRVDGFSDHPKNALHVPDALFFGRQMDADLSNEYGSSKKSAVKIDGLIHILNSYKFTVTENTPIEEEIALDPELLGRIFENLLAEYNPETEKTARKETGSFYTPRTIVDYMVNESLKAYLEQQLVAKVEGMSAEDARVGLDILFAYTEKEHPFTQREQQVLIDAIYDIKVLDPACGSGAFPIGMLQKLLYVLDKLDHRHDRWKERILKDTPAAMRDETRKLLERSSAEYSWKLGLIQNCIYGVDIQPIAVQIAKLRCFIALLVDFEVKQEEDNFGVPALPNLAFKFVAADTLIKPPGEEEQGLFSDPFFEKFAVAAEEFFFVKSPKEKDRLRKQIEALIEEKITKNETALAGRKGADLADATHRKVLAERNKAAIDRQEYEKALWESYRNLFARRNDFVRFFDIRYFFPEVKAGFDILIGNPPYKQIQTFPKEKKDEWVAQNYQTYAATADIYCLFYERGADLLKLSGHLCYITSNKWMRADYGDGLQRFLGGLNLKRLLDFGGILIFGSATVDTCVLLVEKSTPGTAGKACYFGREYEALNDLADHVTKNGIPFKPVEGESWVVMSPHVFRIKQLVAEQGVPLKQWALSINYGIKTGLNEAFYLTQEERDALVAREPQAEQILVPLLRGRFVERYGHSWDGTWMINTHNGVKESGVPPVDLPLHYPKTFAHLQRFETPLRKRQDKGDQWFNLRNCAYVEDFNRPKIIYPNMTKFLPFYWDVHDRFFINDKAFIVNSSQEPLAYLAAIFNSSIFRCCFKDNFPTQGEDRRELRKVFFDQIPIKRPILAAVTLFSPLVTGVQLAKRWKAEGNPSPDVVAAFLEEVIDSCVMEIYFAEHMRERRLEIMEHVRPLLPTNLDQLSESEQWRAAAAFFAHANAPDHPIRNRLMRISTDSPELLAVIKEEGKV